MGTIFFAYGFEVKLQCGGGYGLLKFRLVNFYTVISKNFTLRKVRAVKTPAAKKSGCENSQGERTGNKVVVLDMGFYTLINYFKARKCRVRFQTSYVWF